MTGCSASDVCRSRLCVVFVFWFRFRFLSLFTHTINQKHTQTHVRTNTRRHNVTRTRTRSRTELETRVASTHPSIRSFVQSSLHRREGIYLSSRSLGFIHFISIHFQTPLLTIYSFNAADVNVDDGKNGGGDGDVGDDIFCVRVDDAKVRVITRDWVLRTSCGWFVERGVLERGRRRRRTRESIGGGLRRRRRPGREPTTTTRTPWWWL